MWEALFISVLGGQSGENKNVSIKDSFIAGFIFLTLIPQKRRRTEKLAFSGPARLSNRSNAISKRQIKQIS